MLFENENDTDEPEVVDVQLGEDGANAETDDSADIAQYEETVAKARGWVPKEDYRGRPEDWQDAKSFLDRNASLHSEVRELRDRLSEKEEEYAERIRRIEAANERIIQEDRQRLINQIELQKRQAAEIGDVEAYDSIRRQESDYYKRIAETERQNQPPARQERQEQTLLPETQDWLRRNSWFHESQAMQHIALGFYNESLEGMPAQRDEGKRLAYVEKKMAEVYPDKFGGGKSSAVESGRRAPAGGNKQVYQLSAEERAACKRFIARGLIKDEKQYIDYLNDQ